MTGRPRLVVDTDGGIDDALALLLLGSAGRPPDLVTVSYGNVALEAATRNTLSTMALGGLTAPVHAGAARPLTALLIDAVEVHGQDGLAGAPRPVGRPAPDSDDAVGALRAFLRDAAASGEPCEVLTLGPLTNVALALRIEPGVAAGVGRLVVMGGTCRGRGNTTPSAEFNVYADPEAAQAVLTAGLPTTIVPWETCVDCAVAGAEVDAALAAASPGALRDFVEALTGFSRQRRLRLAGHDAMVLPDPLAAAVLLEPTMASRVVTAQVAVELAGTHTRGALVVDPSLRLGTPRVAVVEEAARERLVELFAGILTAR